MTILDSGLLFFGPPCTLGDRQWPVAYSRGAGGGGGRSLYFFAITWTSNSGPFVAPLIVSDNDHARAE